MTAMPPPMTPEEFVALPDDGRNYELIDGRLKEFNVSKVSDRANVKIARFIDEYCDDHGGWAHGTELGFRCFPNSNRVRKADASYIPFSAMPVATYTDERYCSTPPELVAEVVSPNDLAVELDAKVEEWLSAGVKVVWVIQPDHKTVRVHRADGTYAFLRESDTLTEPGVIPGFALPVARLFRQPGPPPA